MYASLAISLEAQAAENMPDVSYTAPTQRPTNDITETTFRSREPLKRHGSKCSRPWIIRLVSGSKRPGRSSPTILVHETSKHTVNASLLRSRSSKDALNSRKP